MKPTKEETDYFFNEGRLNCDKKWQTAIKDRIEELEKSTGIRELRKLLKDYKYTWKNDALYTEGEKDDIK